MNNGLGNAAIGSMIVLGLAIVAIVALMLP
jgi:hypothetical protein